LQSLAAETLVSVSVDSAAAAGAVTAMPKTALTPLPMAWVEHEGSLGSTVSKRMKLLMM